MPMYNVHLDIHGVMLVSARNPEEAKQIALDDTLDGIGTMAEVNTTMILMEYIDVAEESDGDAMIFKVSMDEESYQCPNCDAWGFDVKKAFCKECDVDETS